MSNFNIENDNFDVGYFDLKPPSRSQTSKRYLMAKCEKKKFLKLFFVFSLLSFCNPSSRTRSVIYCHPENLLTEICFETKNKKMKK